MDGKRWDGAIASVALLILAGLGRVGGGLSEGQPVSDPVGTTCGTAESQPPNERFLLVVSTLDGSVTALNGETGDVQWSLTTGTGPLLSSSISQLQLSRNGIPTRLIPSLDGGLYQLDGDGIEPVPLAADVLLSSTFRLTDNAMVVGGKEIESYGIDLNTGKVRYVCSTSGCKFFETQNFGAEMLEDVLVVKRSDRTVRAVEMHSGQEKWNFSVGQHDLTFVSRASRSQTYDDSGLVDAESPEMLTGRDTVELDDKYNYVWTTVDKFDSSDVDVKVRLSTGLVHAISRSKPDKIYWQHKFDSAVAATWILRDNQLSEMSLFDDSNILDVDSEAENQSEFGPRLVYIGMYNDQLYVQPSVQMLEEVEAATDEAIRKGSLTDVSMPRVRWRPYIASAPSRTPVVSNDRQTNRLIDYDKDSDLEHSSTDLDKSLIVPGREQYPFDGGYYLYLDYTPAQPFKRMLEPKKKKVPTATLR